MQRLLSLGLVLAVIGAPAVAGADVVESPPASCPAGAVPETGHSGPYCRPDADCTGDAACGPGRRCAGASEQCIETRPCGGQTPDDRPCTIEHVAGPCGAGRACPGGQECRARRFCVVGPAPTGPERPSTTTTTTTTAQTTTTTTDDDGCAAAPHRARAGIGIGVLLLGVGAVVLARRRGRRGRGLSR